MGTPLSPKCSPFVRRLSSTHSVKYKRRRDCTCTWMTFSSHFASDVTLSQVEEAFHKLRNFSAKSGLQLNPGKSAYMS